MLAHREKMENPITHQMSKQYTRMRESKSHHNKTVHGFNHAIPKLITDTNTSASFIVLGYGKWQQSFVRFQFLVVGVNS